MIFLAIVIYIKVTDYNKLITKQFEYLYNVPEYDSSIIIFFGKIKETFFSQFLYHRTKTRIKKNEQRKLNLSRCVSLWISGGNLC